MGRTKLTVITTATVLAACGFPATAAAEPPPGTNVLAYVDQVPQSTKSYCGPATAVSMIKALKAYGKISTTRSKADNRTLTQPTLASDAYLKTASAGTQKEDMVRTLKKWTGLNYYVVVSEPSIATFTRNLKTDIDRSYPIAVATREVGGAVHYNNHPANKSIGHWIVARGYSGNGNTTFFADPAASTAVGWRGVQPYFSYPTAAFVSNWVGPNTKGAMVW